MSRRVIQSILFANQRRRQHSLFLISCLFLIVSTSASTPSTVAAPIMENIVLPGESSHETLVVFSDVDGTLVHYPEKVPRGTKGNSILKLPPSSTGLRGVISSKTIAMVRDVRKKGVKFVLVSGMRTSTLLARLPFLPRADAYCTEAGGRIFYPVDSGDDTQFSVTPQKFDGCTDEDLKPFGLEEDMEWRASMEKVAGNYGLKVEELANNPSKVPDLNERDGLLWDFARHLSSRGYHVDATGYSVCFRVNEKQQTDEAKKTFASLSNGKQEIWDGLGTSVNLACVDFYPAESGKKNCCQYLAEKFCPDFNEDSILHNHAVCICDDDNDVEMASACRHAFIPEISSENMAALIEKFPEHFSLTGGKHSQTHGTASSEAALSLILKRLAEEEENTKDGAGEKEEEPAPAEA